MRALLIILLYVIWGLSSDAPRPWVAAPTGAMLLALGYAGLVGVMGLWGRWVGRRGGDTYGEFAGRVDRFNLGMGVARGAVPAWFAVAVFGLGWRHAVDRAMRRALGEPAATLLATPGVVVGLLPGLFAWAGLWWSQYPVDRAIREQGVLAQLEADLPVFAPPPFAGYFANKLRVQLLFTLVPVLIILLLRDAATEAFWTAAHHGRLGVRWPLSDAADSAVSAATVGLVLLGIPLVLRHVLSTRRLPDGRLRQALDRVLQLAGVRCREVLLWDTHNNTGNAAVMGLVPPVRYVLLSDLLLESMTDEHVQAVFAHELGHVRHRHLVWFTLVLGSAMAALSVGGDWLGSHLHPRTPAGAVAVQAGMVAALAAFVWTAYGVLSRWFERQADVFAARLMDRAVPGHVGPATFADALRRVAVVNNIPYAARNWTHGSIAARVAFIERLAVDPAVGRRFDATGLWVRLGLVVSVLACAAVAAMGLLHAS